MADFSSNNENNFEEFRMITQPSESSVSARKAICRTSGTTKRSNMRSVLPRAQTSELRERKVVDDIWRTKVTNKM